MGCSYLWAKRPIPTGDDRCTTRHNDSELGSWKLELECGQAGDSADPVPWVSQSCGKAGAFCERDRHCLENGLIPLTVTFMTESGSEDGGPDLALGAYANDNIFESLL